tara:strand:+ start:5137 stop:6828 length:1692 start_codon:yes stop_codon:yes gene_type:complete
MDQIIDNNELNIYLRVSSESQMEEGFGLENQKTLGLKVSEKLGMKPKIWDEGSKSSSSDLIEERPILNDLMFQINEGKVKNLWVFNNDRLSRNENVWNTIRICLRRNECKLYVGEGTEYNLQSHMDDFIFGVMSEVSKYDQRVRTDRLRRGKFSKIKSGGWKGGPTPFGYSNKDGKLVKNSYESKWVRKIYEEYLKGTTVYGIRKLLMKNGVLSRRGNVVWSDRSIFVILELTYYEGYWTYTDKMLKETLRIECPKILPSTLVKKVREKLKKNTHKSNRIKFETLLVGKLRCGHCGSKYGQRISTYKYHYYCRGNGDRLRKDGFIEKVCKTTNGGRVRSLYIDDTDKLVWNGLIDVMEKSHLYKEMFKKERMDVEKSFGKSEFEIKGYERRIKQNERKIKDIDDSIKSQMVDGILNTEDTKNFKILLNKFEEKKRDLISENEQFNSLIYQNQKTKKWVNWIEDFRDKIEDMKNSDWSFEEKSKFINEVVDEINVSTIDQHTHKIDIELSSPFVDDELIWNVKGSPKKGYKIKEGKNLFTVNLQTVSGRGNVNRKDTKKKLRKS